MIIIDGVVYLVVGFDWIDSGTDDSSVQSVPIFLVEEA